jgi:hypothetical protein
MGKNAEIWEKSEEKKRGDMGKIRKNAEIWENMKNIINAETWENNAEIWENW